MEFMPAKRTRGRVDRETHDEMMDRMRRDFNRLTAELGDVSQYPLLDKIAIDATNLKTAAMNSENVAVGMLQSLPKPTLQKVLTALESKNGDHKLASLKSYLFSHHMQHLRELGDKVKTIDMMALQSTSIAFTMRFADDDGMMQWSKVKQCVLDCISAHDQQLGAAAAVAAATAATANQMHTS